MSINEKLRDDWKVDGTTGYDFLNYVNMLLVDGNSEEELTEFYESFIGREINIDELITQSKRLVANQLFKGDIERLSKLLNVDYEYLVDFLACIKKYRTYLPYEDISTIKQCDKEGRLRDERGIMRLQQYMPAIFAKGYEDTTLFIYNRLISLNEVGSDLRRFSISIEDFHNFNLSRVNSISMNTLSTHDTKFSEDVRARISVLSEIPKEWEERVVYWHDLLKPNIDKNDEYRFYQTLVGSYEGFDNKERIKNHIIKVIREAKVHTTWENPNSEYENKVLDFIDGAFESSSFRNDFENFEKRIVYFGYMKSLVATTLKFLSPGIPDIYQGTEVWRFLLTDPDNRMPVNFKKLRELLNSLTEKNLELSDPRVKMLYVKKLLQLRREYLLNDYKPLPFGFQRGKVTVLFSPIVTREIKEKINIRQKSVDWIRNEEISSGEYNLSELIGEHKVVILTEKSG